MTNVLGTAGFLALSVRRQTGQPKRVYSSFVRGIEQMPVRIPG